MPCFCDSGHGLLKPRVASRPEDSKGSSHVAHTSHDNEQQTQGSRSWIPAVDVLRSVSNPELLPGASCYSNYLRVFLDWHDNTFIVIYNNNFIVHPFMSVNFNPSLLLPTWRLPTRIMIIYQQTGKPCSKRCDEYPRRSTRECICLFTNLTKVCWIPTMCTRWC